MRIDDGSSDVSTRLAVVCAIAVAIAAGDAASAYARRDAEWPSMPVVTWQEADLQRGWLAKTILLSDVRGVNGQDLGMVEGIFIGEDRTITRLTVENGGLLNFAPSTISVPWKEVRPVNGMNKIVVDTSNLPVTSDDCPEWDVTRLLEDSFSRYGHIDDILFDRDGKLLALITLNPVRLRR